MDDNQLAMLRPWLEAQLQSLSDAEPQALADYVLALLKNDRPPAELRQHCQEQLVDFLRDSTVPFVDALMDACDHIQQDSRKTDSQNPQSQQAQNQQQIEQQQIEQQIQQQIQPFHQPPTQPQAFNGQTQFRQNFRPGNPFSPAGLDQNQMGFGDFGLNADFNPESGQWINGVFVPGPAPPAPSNSGFIRGGRGGDRGFRGRGGARGGRGGQRGGRMGSFDRPPVMVGPNDDYANKRLVLEKVPAEHLNEKDIREYFSQFGNLVDIKVNERTNIVEMEYEAHDQARKAWNNPDSIFGNRFVKLYWRRPDQQSSGAAPAVSVDLDSVQRIQEERQREFEDKQAKQRQHQAKMRELLEKKAQILKMRKEQQELLIKTAQEQGITEELEDKISSTNLLQLQLEQLQAEAQALGVDTDSPMRASPYYGGRGGTRGGITKGYRGGRGAYRGRGGYRGGYGGGSTFNPGSFNLDLRPKTVVVSPIPQDKEEVFHQYLMSLGEYDKVDRAGPEGVSITFRDRKTAERLFYGPDTIPEVGHVSKKWDANAAPSATTAPVVEGSTDPSTTVNPPLEAAGDGQQ